MPERYDEFLRLKSLSAENRKEIEEDEIVRKYSWVGGIDHKGNLFDVIELDETTVDKQTRFVWLTNLRVGKNNIVKIAKGGRL